ncbi:MAG: hypothetical protein WBN77_02890 [Desulfobacterales bacterium]
MPSFSFKMRGFAAANRDVKFELVEESTGTKIERKPFRDGSLTVRDLNPGFYQLKVIHPNLINPIDQRRIRLYPQKQPTVVHIPVPEDLFKDSPIRDIPDVDLTPIQQAATKSAEMVKPLSPKAPGEVIRSNDWNMLVDAVSDLSNAVLELTNLVSPRGHDHPEIAEKIAEVQGNLIRFSEAYGKSLLELQREIEMANLKKNVEDTLDAAEASNEVRERVINRVKEMEEISQTNTILFTQKLASTGSFLLAQVNEMAVAKGDQADAFISKEAVQKTMQMANLYAETGPVVNAEQEINTYRKSSAATGGSKFTGAVGNTTSKGGIK